MARSTSAFVSRSTSGWPQRSTSAEHGAHFMSSPQERSQVNVEQAKEILDQADRYELRDHAFGDTEVTWAKDGVEVGGGYFSNFAYVWVEFDEHVFKGDIARALRNCGKEVVVDRNDAEGPDIYVEGKIMPGLTLEGVKQELTQEKHAL